MNQQLIEIKEQLSKLTGLINELSEQRNQQEFAFTFQATTTDIADTYKMRANHVEFFRALYEKFGRETFSAGDDFLHFTAYKYKILDMRETMFDVGLKRGFIVIIKSSAAKSARHKSYQFTKIFK